MKHIFSSLTIIFISTFAFSQNSELTMDSVAFQPLELFTESVPKQTLESIILNNGKDTLFLEPIKPGSFIGFMEEYSLSTTVNSNENRQEGNVLPPDYRFITYGKVVKIMDSIDINNDGVKELFLFRQMQSRMTPPNSGPYGVGVENRIYYQYEVWNVKSKRKIFEVQNGNNGSVAISTNVMSNFGYSFEVTINKNGSLNFSKFQGTSQTQVEMGEYVFDKTKGKYQKK